MQDNKKIDFLGMKKSVEFQEMIDKMIQQNFIFYIFDIIIFLKSITA